jgi:hypothetical protein
MKAWICRTAVLSVMLTLAWSTPARAQSDLQATLVEIERSLWEAWKNGEWDVFRGHMVEAAVNNGAGGVMAPRDAMIQSMQAEPCEVASYALSDFQVHRVASGTAILTYRAEQAGTCGGETLRSPVWSSSVFVNQDGRWMNALYQETPIG